jgi:hypothetical protein
MKLVAKLEVADAYKGERGSQRTFRRFSAQPDGCAG